MTTTAEHDSDTRRVVVVGSINVDQVITVNRIPLAGETLIGSSLRLLPGGKGANQAVAAALRGAPTTLIGAVGNDPYAGIATAMLAASGVDAAHLDVIEGPTGLAVVTVDAAGENMIVVVPGANAAVDEAAVLRNHDVIAAAAVVVLQGEIAASGIAAAARLATGRVVLNLAPVIEIDPGVVALANPLVVNEHEASLLLAQLTGDAENTCDDAELVARLRAWGIPSVVLTRGPQGAICSDSSGTESVPSPKVLAVDTSGAGDAFVGALSAALAEGASLVAAVQQAVRVGAYAVQSSGTQPSYPGLDDTLPGGSE
jgi:ribokinase